MQLSVLAEQCFQTATHCHTCEEELGTDRVRDHCHLTGKFWGAAHNDYNWNFKFTSRIPLVFHNLKNYDAHLIIKAMGFIKNRPISCIPTNDEKYISFSIGDLTFIDSTVFECLIRKTNFKLTKEGFEKFRVLKSYIEEEKIPLLLMKGVYPYEYFDSFEKFSETVLPPKSFLLLAVVFENFRGICLNYYKLDPAHFYTAPSLSWAACLKMTNVELQLITDIDMHLYL